MTWLKRIFLLIAVNFLVIMTVSFLLSFFHVSPYLRSTGLDIPSLLAFCLIWGFTGAFISLLISKKIAIWMMRVQIIPSTASDPTSLFLKQAMQRLSQRASLGAIPEVGIFKSPQINAFATGASKKKSLVAVSTGLLNQLSDEQVEAVLAHEISHIQNGDMVTMTILQGVINSFVLFLSRILAYAMSGMNRNRRSGGSIMSFYFLTFLFEFVFMLLGSAVVAFFSRKREFRADRGGAELTTNVQMIRALEGLQKATTTQARIPEAFQSLMMQPGKGFSLLKVFASHPSLEDRIEALKHL